MVTSHSNSSRDLLKKEFTLPLAVSPISVIHQGQPESVESIALTPPPVGPRITTTAKLTNSTWPTLKPSDKSLRTRNVIREIVDPIVANLHPSDRTDGKEFISLALGDPSAYGNFPPCPALVPSILSPQSGAPYVNAIGTDAARLSIAAFHSVEKLLQYEADDVIVASGCSGALELVLTALLDSDSILLVPQPGFPLYSTIATSHGASIEYYRLREDQNWEVDLTHVQTLVQRFGHRVRGILINNPSNPTGAVYSESHLRDIIQVCDACHLPMVADEIYGDIVFGDDQEYHPLAKVASAMGNRVPVITCSGLAKQFLLPGWRIGWALFHDNVWGSLAAVHAGTKRLASVIMGASHLAQTVVPVLLDRSNAQINAWREGVRLALQAQRTLIARRLSKIPGLSVLPSGGAMYLMVRLVGPCWPDDQVFCQELLREENVLLLPGTCFGIPNAFRVVFSVPDVKLEQAADRIEAFCCRRSFHS